MKIKTDFLGPISWGKLHILEGRELMLFLLQNYFLVKHLATVILKIASVIPRIQFCMTSPLIQI